MTYSIQYTILWVAHSVDREEEMPTTVMTTYATHAYLNCAHVHGHTHCKQYRYSIAIELNVDEKMTRIEQTSLCTRVTPG